LRTERGNGADLSLRVRQERLRGEAAVFYNRIDDFIFPSQTGETTGGLPVVALTQTDALLFGLEAHVDLGLTGWLWLELGADAVRGQQRANDEPLPRIPPYRLWSSVRFERGGWHAEATLKHAGEQDRTYGAETPTAGYTVCSAHASYSFAVARTTHTLTARLDNASDETYRNHLSYVKDLAPEMGRSLRVLYGLRF
jgi:iron complex outermembrane receptor protein